MNPAFVAISVAILASSVFGGDYMTSTASSHMLTHLIQWYVFLQMGATMIVKKYMIQTMATARSQEQGMDPQLNTTVMKAMSCLEGIKYENAKAMDTGLAMHHTAERYMQVR